jgi:hypothetical protein
MKRTIIALVFMGAVAVLSAQDNEAAAGGTVGVKPNTGVAGGETATSAADTTAALEALANAVRARTAAIEAPGENLYNNVLRHNAETLDKRDKSRTSSGVASPLGRAIVIGNGALTIGGEITDIDNDDAFPTAPQTVHFITSERNQLAALDNKMKRASSWINKHTCGGFDWTAQFNFMFKTEVLKEYVKALGEGVIAAAPMALLGAFSPQLAEIVKHLKLIAGMDLAATKMDCQQIQNALTDGTRRAMWGDAYSDCLNAQKDQGISQATKICQSSLNTSVTTSDGAKTNPQTSQPASTGGGWLTNSYSATQDWFANMYPAGNAQASGAQATGASGTAAGNGGASGNYMQSLLGIANAGSGGSGGAVNSLMGNNMSGPLGSLANSLFGSVRLQGTGALELGRKSYKLFELQLKVYSSQLRDNLSAQLLTHYDLIRAGSTDHDELRRSYDYLKLWTYQSRGAEFNIAPWRNPVYNEKPVEFPVEYLGQQITDHTMDACAYLMKLSAEYRNNNSVLYPLYEEYGVEEFITSLSLYECYLFVYKTYLDQYKQLRELTAKQSPSGVDNSAVQKAAMEQFDSAMIELNKGMIVRQNVIVQRLKKINEFRPWAIEKSVGSATAGQGAMPQPETRFNQ